MTLYARRGLTISVGLILALLLAACGGSGEVADTAPATEAEAMTEAAPTTEPSPPEPADTAAEAMTDTEAPMDATEAAAGEMAVECTEPTVMRIAIPVQPPKFAMVTPDIADELGYFDDFCIDAEIITFRAGINSLRALQAGDVEIAVPPSASLINAVGEGSPIVGWLSPANQLPQLILATQDVGSCEDFEGQTVATGGPGDLVHHLMQTFLDSCGLEIGTDVDVFVGSPADFGPQLAQGIAQGSALHVDDKMVIEQAQDVTLDVLADAADILPDFHYQLLASSQEYVDANRDVVVNAAAAMLKANQWMTDPANREEVIELANRVTERDLDIMEFAYDRYAEKWPSSCEQGFNESMFDFTIDLQVELGNLDEPIAMDDVIDRSICEDAEELLG